MSKTMLIGVYLEHELIALFNDDADAGQFINNSRKEDPNGDYKEMLGIWECYRKE